MELLKSEQEFIKQYRDILSGIFKKRVEELKEDMILEVKEEEREKIRELVIEFKRWLTDIGIIVNDKEVKKDSGI